MDEEIGACVGVCEWAAAGWPQAVAPQAPQAVATGAGSEWLCQLIHFPVNAPHNPMPARRQVILHALHLPDVSVHVQRESSGAGQGQRQPGGIGSAATRSSFPSLHLDCVVLQWLDS